MENNNQQAINIADGNTIPIFVDDVLVGTILKGNKGKNGKIVKEGYLTLVGIDLVSQKPVSRIVLSKINAETVATRITDSIKKLDEELAKPGDIKNQMLLDNKNVDKQYIG